MRFNSLFRSTEQQINIVPVGTTKKARPGSSLHEAGLAVDVSGMNARSDVPQIVAAFQAQGFNWLAPGDRPHFQLAPYTVGEADKFAVIRRAQDDYKSGRWRAR